MPTEVEDSTGYKGGKATQAARCLTAGRNNPSECQRATLLATTSLSKMDMGCWSQQIWYLAIVSCHQSAIWASSYWLQCFTARWMSPWLVFTIWVSSLLICTFHCQWHWSARAFVYQCASAHWHIPTLAYLYGIPHWQFAGWWACLSILIWFSWLLHNAPCQSWQSMYIDRITLSLIYNEWHMSSYQNCLFILGFSN